MTAPLATPCDLQEIYDEAPPAPARTALPASRAGGEGDVDVRLADRRDRRVPCRQDAGPTPAGSPASRADVPGRPARPDSSASTTAVSGAPARRKISSA
jgi:hypothetical protein